MFRRPFPPDLAPPERDLTRRRPLWQALQTLWLDTDPAVERDALVRACRASGYTLAQLEAIVWNELRPALAANLRSAAPVWSGFDAGWLEDRILARHRHGRPLPPRWWDRALAAEWDAIARALGGAPPAGAPTTPPGEDAAASGAAEAHPSPRDPRSDRGTLLPPD